MSGSPQDPKVFEAATDAAASQGSGPIDESGAVCQGNWIKIRYEYEDGTGVPGASYVVQTVTEDGSPTGQVLAEGKTDDNGDAHVCLPDEHTQVEFYFHDDPEGEPYEDPEAAKPLEEPEKGFWESLWRSISDGADWVWGILKGDFEEDPSTSQIIGRMILTMIPGIDQIADAQDIIHILYRLIWRREWDVPMHWVLLVITLIGLIPVFGSLAKGLLKLVIKKAGDVSALRALYGIFNYFRQGNAHRWIRDFATDLTGKHLDTVLELLNDMMARVVEYMEKAKGWLSRSWNAKLDEGIAKVGAFKANAPAKMREAASYLQKQLLDTLRQGMSRIQRKGTRNQEPHVIKQEEVVPDRVIRQDNDFSSTTNHRGHRKSYIDEEGTLNPANPDGDITIQQHVRGTEPTKSNSQYTSTSAVDDNVATVPKSFGNDAIEIDTRRLQEDIDSGRVADVEIIPPKRVQAELQEKINEAQARYDTSPTRNNASRLRNAENDLENAIRDNECLINGCVPSNYIRRID